MDKVFHTHRSRDPIIAILGNLKCPELSHSLSVSNISRRIAEEMGLFSDNTIEEIAYAGLIHDIGKISIDSQILRKGGSLTQEEKMQVMQHALLGATMCPKERMEVIRGVIGHHENWDGTGYPLGLSGECIHPFARIIRAADMIDALLSERDYKKGWGEEKTKSYILEKKGTYLEPTIVDSVVSIWDEVVLISQRSHGCIIRRDRGVDIPIPEPS